MIRILIVDDHDLVREGLRTILEQESGFEVVGEAGDGQEAIRAVSRLAPDVVLMDLNLPGGLGGLEATEVILADRPETKVVVLTQYEQREYVARALRIGAQGYVVKRSASRDLKEAIKAVHQGRRYLHPMAAGELAESVSRGETFDEGEYDSLTPRERQVLKLLAEGKTSREIARYLGVSPKTAMTHRANLMGKLGLHSRAEVVKYAVRKNLIDLDGP